MLTNQPSQVTATLGSGLYSGRMYEWGLFAQDDWKISPKLTLNLGLRYDYYSNFVAKGEDGTPEAGLYNPELLAMDGTFQVGPSGRVTTLIRTTAITSDPGLALPGIPMAKAKRRYAWVWRDVQ